MFMKKLRKKFETKKYVILNSLKFKNITMNGEKYRI